MAKSVVPSSFKHGFKQPGQGAPWQTSPDPVQHVEGDYYTPPSAEILTSPAHNDLGINVMRTWPTVYNGINHGGGSQPEWWSPSSEVDVLICGAGPSGLQVALSLARQGVKFRIVDNSETPLIAGRADGVQPRFLEVLNSWGLANEVAEEGPIIERTAIYKNGRKLLFGRSHQSDSRYRGLHVITQGQIERIYIRDLLRHKYAVERNSTISDFRTGGPGSHPVTAKITNNLTGQESQVRAKYLVGCDGASSKIRKQLGIRFDGVTTDLYWGIMDCVFESDYPHAWIFGAVVSSRYGGCIIIPREDGYIRLYTQLDISKTGPLAQSRQESDPSFRESGGRVDVSNITPDEVLDQANRIFAPYKLRFAAPLSWFAVWKISERVASSFSSPDQQCHLVGDAAHVHSVMGAFGLNASIMDSANLAWKLGLCARGLAKPYQLLPTYSDERRLQAMRIIKASGEYLRFVCNSRFPLAVFEDAGKDKSQTANGLREGHTDGDANEDTNGHANVPSGVRNVEGERAQRKSKAEKSTVNGVSHHTTPESDSEQEAADLQFLGRFFATNGPFLLGVDAAYPRSILAPRTGEDSASGAKDRRPIEPLDGVRAPNPRVCFSSSETGYLYDRLTGVDAFHIVAFVSNMQGRMRLKTKRLLSYLASDDSFYHKYGGRRRFKIVLVAKCLPFEFASLVDGQDLQTINEYCEVVFDDRVPDEDAHTTYGVNHHEGSVVAVRPDLWIGTSVVVSEVSRLADYFDGFLERTPCW